MKNLFKYLLLVIGVVLYCSCTSNIKTDLEKAGLKGKIKSIREISYEAFGSADTLVQGEILANKDNANCFTTFNEKGFIVSLTNYDIDNEKESYWIFYYNKDGDKQLSGAFYDRHNYKLDSTHYTYNKKGLPTEYTHYNSDNFVRNKILSSFDRKGNIIEEKVINPDNSIESISRFKYHKNLLVEGKVFDKNNKLKTTSTYTYDKKGNMTSMTLFGSDGMYISKGVYTYYAEGYPNTEHISRPGYTDLVLNYIYTLDHNGNWVERIMLSEGEAFKITKREIEYFE